MRDDLIAAIARSTIYPYNRSKYRKYQALLAQAPRLERDGLLEMVKRNAGTGFGRAHGFSEIGSIADFRARVPISDYAGMAPYLDAVARGETRALFPSSERLLEFCCTSGTTGQPKVFPITQRWLNTYQRHWRIWGVKALMDHPAIMQKKWLQISGSTRIGRTASGHHIGMISAITARYQNPLMKFGFAAPHDVGNIADSTTRNYALLRLAIVQPVGFIITITAANLIGMAQLADRMKETLIRDIHDGAMSGGAEGQQLPEGRLRTLMRTPHQKRASELERIVEATGTLYPKDFWQLELVACWTSGTAGYQTRNLPAYYGNTPVRDVGYISSEGRHTITTGDGSAGGRLVAGGAFYEFIPQDGGEALNGSELEIGKTYTVLLTSDQGLYRYQMGDIVRCNGFEGPTPVLEFLCKTEQFSDLEGEKISGDQIAAAMAECAQRLGVTLESFAAIPLRAERGASYYAFAIEPLSLCGDAERRLIAMIDEELGKLNFLYRYKQADGSLAPAHLLVVEQGTFATRTNLHTARTGTGETQYKPPVFLSASALAEFKILRTIRNTTAAQGGPGAAA